MIFQDPFASLNPRWRVGDIVAEPIRAFGARDAGAGGLGKRAVAARVDELLDSSASIPPTRAKFPHEFSGGQRQRDRDRPRARRAPRFHRLRRADLGAGRLDPGADPEPDARPAGEARPHLSLDHPQSGGGALHGDPGRRDVSRPARRDRRDRRAVRKTPPSLYAHAARRRARPFDERARAHARRRRAAQPDRSAARLPVPSALPAGDRDLQIRAARFPRQRRLSSRRGG